MSYILDALRKADSERERGEVPGLHAHPVIPTAENRSGSKLNQKLLLAVGVLATALLLTLIWLVWGRGSGPAERPLTPPDQASVNPPSTAPMSPPPSVNGTQNTLPMPPPATAQTAPMAVPPTTGMPTPGQYPPAVSAQPPVTAEPPTAALSKPPASPRTNSEAVPDTPPRKATANATGKTSEDNKVYRLMDLPESVRRDLPTLTIGGAMYSDTPSNRMLIINSQVLHEGDKITADLTLEEIKLKSAVFRFRNYRYLVSY